MSLVIVGRKNTLLRREARKEIKRGKSLYFVIFYTEN